MLIQWSYSVIIHYYYSFGVQKWEGIWISTQYSIHVKLLLVIMYMIRSMQINMQWRSIILYQSVWLFAITQCSIWWCLPWPKSHLQILLVHLHEGIQSAIHNIFNRANQIQSHGPEYFETIFKKCFSNKHSCFSKNIDFLKF